LLHIGKIKSGHQKYAGRTPEELGEKWRKNETRK